MRYDAVCRRRRVCVCACVACFVIYIECIFVHECRCAKCVIIKYECLLHLNRMLAHMSRAYMHSFEPTTKKQTLRPLCRAQANNAHAIGRLVPVFDVRALLVLTPRKRIEFRRVDRARQERSV